MRMQQFGELSATRRVHSCRLASGRRVEELDFGPATVTADNGKRYVHVRPHGLDLYLKFVVQYETANGCLWARCEHCVQDREMVTRFSDRRSQPSKPPFTPSSRVKPSFSDTDIPKAQKLTPALQQTPHTFLSKVDTAPPRPINAVSTTAPQQATGAAPQLSSSTTSVPPQRSSPTAGASPPVKPSNTSPAAPQSGEPQLPSHAIEAASQPVRQTTVAAPQKPAILASAPRQHSQTATARTQQATTLQSDKKRRTPSPPHNKSQMVLKRLQKSPLALKNLPRRSHNTPPNAFSTITAQREKRSAADAPATISHKLRNAAPSPQAQPQRSTRNKPSMSASPQRPTSSQHSAPDEPRYATRRSALSVAASPERKSASDAKHTPKQTQNATASNVLSELKAAIPSAQQAKKAAVTPGTPQTPASPVPGPSRADGQQFREKVVNYRDESKRVIDYPSKRYPGVVFKYQRTSAPSKTKKRVHYICSNCTSLRVHRAIPTIIVVDDYLITDPDYPRKVHSGELCEHRCVKKASPSKVAATTEKPGKLKTAHEGSSKYDLRDLMKAFDGTISDFETPREYAKAAAAAALQAPSVEAAPNSATPEPRGRPVRNVKKPREHGSSSQEPVKKKDNVGTHPKGAAPTAKGTPLSKVGASKESTTSSESMSDELGTSAAASRGAATQTATPTATRRAAASAGTRSAASSPTATRRAANPAPAIRAASPVSTRSVASSNATRSVAKPSASATPAAAPRSAAKPLVMTRRIASPLTTRSGKAVTPTANVGGKSSAPKGVPTARRTSDAHKQAQLPTGEAKEEPKSPTALTPVPTAGERRGRKKRSLKNEATTSPSTPALPDATGDEHDNDDAGPKGKKPRLESVELGKQPAETVTEAQKQTLAEKEPELREKPASSTGSPALTAATRPADIPMGAFGQALYTDASETVVRHRSKVYGVELLFEKILEFNRDGRVVRQYRCRECHLASEKMAFIGDVPPIMVVDGRITSNPDAPSGMPHLCMSDAVPSASG